MTQEHDAKGIGAILGTPASCACKQLPDVILKSLSNRREGPLAVLNLACMLNSWPLPRDSATYGSGPSVAEAAVMGEGPALLPPPGLAVPPSGMTPAGRAGPPPSDGKSDSSNVISASDFEPPAPACNAYHLLLASHPHSHRKSTMSGLSLPLWSISMHRLHSAGALNRSPDAQLPG